MKANFNLHFYGFQLLPYITGYNHVSKIAADTNVEKTLVKSCIQNLVYYGVVCVVIDLILLLYFFIYVNFIFFWFQVTLIPVIKFTNMYRATPNLCQLFSDHELQKSCLSFITKGCDSKEKVISFPWQLKSI